MSIIWYTNRRKENSGEGCETSADVELCEDYQPCWGSMLTKDNTPPDDQQLSEWAVIRILDDIRDGLIKQGERLVERNIADRLNISRAPIRDAFHRLESIGVVERRETRGICVRFWTEHDAAEILYLMDALIFLSVKLAVGRLTDADFAELERIVSETKHNAELEMVDRSIQLALDLEFHHIIARATGHRRLIDQLKELTLPLDLWPKVFMRRILPDFSYRQHSELIESLRSGDREIAVNCVVRHQQETEALEMALFGPPAANAAGDEAPRRRAQSRKAGRPAKTPGVGLRLPNDEIPKPNSRKR